MTPEEELGADWDHAIFAINSWLKETGQGAHVHAAVRALLTAAGADIVRPFDMGLSARLAADAQRARCYWNSAEALLRVPEARRGTYVEGIVVHSLKHDPGPPPPIMVSYGYELQIDWQGWLELEGRIVDPTSPLGAVFDPMWNREPIEAILSRSIYLPFARFSRDEAGDLWREIPLSIRANGEAADRTVEATTWLYCAYAGVLQAMELSPSWQTDALRRALRRARRLLCLEEVEEERESSLWPFPVKVGFVTGA